MGVVEMVNHRCGPKLAALEMEVEALKRGSEASSWEKDMVLALEAQTKVLQEALSSRGGGGPGSSVTSIKADLQWPTLTDERSDAKDVALFYMKSLRMFVR